MTSFKLLAASVILSAAAAAPVFAQATIQEPGAYAFYHPDGDLYRGPTSTAGATASVQLGNSMAQLRGATMSHPLRRPHAARPY